MFPYKRTQISDSHCGPAVVEMLLANLGIHSTQQMITAASGAQKTIKKYGTRVDQLAKAVQTLSPESTLYYKVYGALSDIQMLLMQYSLPVAVEWQGMFYENEEEEEEDADYGHYSIVTGIDYAQQVIVLVDPYKDFVKEERIIDMYKFINRWWDINDIIDPVTKEKKRIRDEKLLFVISRKNSELTEKLGMKTFY